VNYFPTLPGLDISIVRTTLYSTSIQRHDRALTERRASWWALPRYRYELKFNFLRQAGYQQTYDEVEALTDFFESTRGGMLPFLLVDPVDSVERVVRFDDVGLTIGRFLSHVFESRVVLISLLGEDGEET